MAPISGANGGTVGMGFDYRLRYHLAPCRAQDFVPGHSIFLRSGPDAEDPMMVSERLDGFFSDLDRVARELAPAGKHLDDEDEWLLDRYCVVLALLEAVVRAGPRYPMPDLSVEGPDGLLQLAPEPAVIDLMNLSRSAEAYFRPLIELVISNLAPYVPNPLFAGSRDVGGADADMIIGDALIELKVTKSLTPGALRTALVQLVGYTLLDYSDEYQIREVSVYFPRQQFMKTWPLWTLVFPLADVVRSNAEPSEVEVLERLGKLRDMMRRAAAGMEINYEAEFA